MPIIILILKRIWSFIKKYWQLFAGALAVVVIVFVFHKREASFVDDYKKIQDAHQQEIEKINQAHEEEIKALQENEKKLQDSLSLIQKQYDDAKKELDSQKKRQVDNIVKNYGSDPVGLTRQLSDITGIPMQFPSE